MEQINWYPGHMAKTKRAIEKDLKLVDIVIELLDARIPHSSKNYDIDTWTNKPKIVVLNKTDMADKTATAIWQKHFEETNPVILLNAKEKNGFAKITAVAEKILKEKKDNAKNRGRIFRPTRAMIVGIPNVGKSTFINSYVNKSIAKAANKPGVTRSNQWIKINKGFELLDTPGMLPPKLENQQVAMNLAITGAIGYNFDNYEVTVRLLSILKEKYPQLLLDRYKLETTDPEPDVLIENIAKARGYMVRGGNVDLNRCANMLLDELRGVKIGQITLELPGENTTDEEEENKNE